MTYPSQLGSWAILYERLRPERFESEDHCNSSEIRADLHLRSIAMRFRRIHVTAAAFILSIALRGVAQSQDAAAKPEFDAASIRLNSERCCQFHGGPGSDDPGRITYSAPIWVLIRLAYDIQSDQIFGRLDDIQGNNFTLSATMPATTNPETYRMMLRNLLAERFHLVLHHETRAFPGYELRIADGGLKMKPWNHDPNSPAVGPHGTAGESGYAYSVDKYPPVVHVQSRQTIGTFAKTLDSLILMSEAISSSENGSVTLDQRLMPMRGQSLPVAPLPRVVDKSGLDGIYDFTLNFEGTYMAGYIPSAGGANLFTALEKQLGLKLVRVKDVPVEVIVVDQVDKTPTDN